MVLSAFIQRLGRAMGFDAMTGLETPIVIVALLGDTLVVRRTCRTCQLGALISTAVGTHSTRFACKAIFAYQFHGIAVLVPKTFA
jgi:hypothetical protein